MFTDNLPFASIIQPHLELMRFIVMIVIILLMIIALSNNNAMGAGPYAALVIATIMGIAETIITQLYKPRAPAP